jgi:vancomycin resistance protein VanJ
MSFLDHWLRQAGEVLADDDSRRALLRKSGRIARGFFGGIALAYAAFLLTMTAALRWVGENNLTLAFLLYLPRILFLLPAAALLPPSLFCSRRAALALVVASIVFLNVAMDLRWRGAPDASVSAPGQSLTIVTYNRGQHAKQSLQPFKNRVSPDIILLQEAGGRAARYLGAEGYEAFPHARDLGEFTILSRYPVTDAEPVLAAPSATGVILAARFTIDFAGEAIAVYSVHAPSPRDTLLHYRRGAFLYGIIGLPGTPLGRKRRENQAYWDERIAQARSLCERIAEDPLPALVAGDFNAPAGGYIHGLFRARFEDAHAAAGHGFGHTFPGTTRNPLSLGGPWMRIDHLFCDAEWAVDWCITEPRRPSQHRAVAAQFARTARPPTSPRPSQSAAIR